MTAAGEPRPVHTDPHPASCLAEFAVAMLGLPGGRGTLLAVYGRPPIAHKA